MRYDKGMNYDSQSFRLFKGKPSFTEGFGSLLRGSSDGLYNVSETPEEADRESLQADWEAIGTDMRHALNHYVQET
ncbi:MAG: hypothetical protein GC178_16600 [Flavobacteriales bacterium]|nr:hypothetical protein [Flavobacteriales bacterium]